MPKSNRNRKIPYFVEIRGCINCSSSESLKMKTGREYGYDPECMFMCLVLCMDYGISLHKPFLDPEEAVRLANNDGSKDAIDKTREYCMYVKDRFGDFYKEMGVSLDDIINNLKVQIKKSD